MSRYIEAEWLKDHIEVISYEGMWHETETDEFVSVENINSAPSIDICFCRECKYTDGEPPIADGRSWCALHGSFMYYCSDGSRSEKPNNLSEIPTGSIRRAPITALEVALSECKARHNGCENCTTECAWRE